MLRRLAVNGALAVVAVWALNSPFLVTDKSQLPTHRGVHQSYAQTGLTRGSGTAFPVTPPLAHEIENAFPACAAAFDDGATLAELDMHPTEDGQFDMFRDWTLDCTTHGTGSTRDHDMSPSRSVDLGYGDSLDDGAGFPLWGTGVWMMPALTNVLTEIPWRSFILNVKTRNRPEGIALNAWGGAHPMLTPQIRVIAGHPTPLGEVTWMGAVTKDEVRAGVLHYAALESSDCVHALCGTTALSQSSNFAPWLWGGANRLLAWMERIGIGVVLCGPISPDTSDGVDAVGRAADIASGFGHMVWTGDVCRMAPVLPTRAP